MNKTLLIFAIIGLMFVSSVHTDETKTQMKEDDPEWENNKNDKLGDREIGEDVWVEDPDKEFTHEDLDKLIKDMKDVMGDMNINDLVTARRPEDIKVRPPKEGEEINPEDNLDL